jgi:hypothetical protein
VVATSEPAAPTVLADLAATLCGENVEYDGSHVACEVPGALIDANLKDGAARVRIRAYLGSHERAVVEGWVDRQPAPISGGLQSITHHDGTVEPRIIFERPVKGNDWSVDPLRSEIRAYAEAWAKDDLVDTSHFDNTSDFQPAGDPRQMIPSSAWLLLGDEASYPLPDELADLRHDGEVGIFDHLWTAAKQTIVGDVALIYFMAPHKAAHFITRAASNAFFARDIAVNAEGEVADEQRWAYFTPLIEIEPIPFKALQAASGGHLILRGRSGKFLRPETMRDLPIRAKDSADQPELDRVLVTPVGLAELPRPEDVSIDVWKAIAAGALPLEAHVSSHIVEPLLRHMLEGTALTWGREHRIRGGSVDFVVFDHGAPSTAIEVKLVVIEPPDGDWSKSKDFRQLRRYTDELGLPGVLIDAHRVLLVHPGHDQPYHDIPRRSATPADLQAIRQHLARNST